MARSTLTLDIDSMGFLPQTDSLDKPIAPKFNHDTTLPSIETDGYTSGAPTPMHADKPIHHVADGEGFKTLVIGNAGVGKTRLTHLFVHQKLLGQTDRSEVGIDHYTKLIVLRDLGDDGFLQTKLIKMNFVDTAGQEKFDAITTAHYRKAIGALVVYSVTDRASFDAVDKWVNDVREFSGPNCQIVLAANKVDVPNQDWEVQSREGLAKADRLGIQFFEVSANKNTGVEDTMTGLARLMCSKYEQFSPNFERFNNTRLTPMKRDLDAPFQLGGNSMGCCMSRVPNQNQRGCC